MAVISRRWMLRAGAGTGAVIAHSIVSAPGAGAAEALTMWVLDPAWGYPIKTKNGPKSRCDGAACHNAATHRFFLSEAEAIAGRLHPCCLAQPKAVTVATDLATIQPYYKARLGGIDNRCPDLPAGLAVALGVPVPPPENTGSDPTPTAGGDPTRSGNPPAGTSDGAKAAGTQSCPETQGAAAANTGQGLAAPAVGPSDESVGGQALAFTGSSATAAALGVGAGAVLAGLAMTAGARERPSEAVEPAGLEGCPQRSK